MTFLSKLVTTAALAALLGFASPVEAQSNGKSKTKAKVSAKSKTKTQPAKTTMPKTKDYDFMADNIDGDRVLPDHDRVLGIGDTKHKSLIRLREHFITEIIRSADML